ncbi:CopG family transcriptional regulator [Fortiea sp. LEGE XX443]|nr:CopG family transcriptional regulator [Fortiea sp. LEGE XX443]MBE9006164.1 CopG family transcriptional regulator [Fortiea sp. LEGE XX443]
MDNTAALEFSSFATPKKKSIVKQITLDLTPDEAQNLEKYCEQTGQAVTNVIEELIRGLPVT